MFRSAKKYRQEELQRAEPTRDRILRLTKAIDEHRPVEARPSSPRHEPENAFFLRTPPKKP